MKQRVSGVERLLGKDPKRWQQSTRSYVAADGPWAARLRKNPVDVDDPRTVGLLVSYLSSRGELDVLEHYSIAAAGQVPGSMGKMHHLVLLDPHDPDEDQRLIDIKDTYDEPDTPWFHNPFGHNGERMIAAGALYAPDWELSPGHATWDGEEYWGREIPTHKLKLKSILPEFEQVDVAFSVASQLGSAHRASMQGMDEDDHIQHFEMRFEEWTATARHLQRELELSHALYVREVLGAYAEPNLLSGT